MKKIIPFIIMLILILFSYNDYSNLSNKAVHWPTTEGKLVEAEVDYRLQSGSSAKKKYIPRIEYSYKVKDNKYTSRKIGLIETPYPLQSSANKVIDKYKKEKVLKVYYDPDDPGIAYLNPNVTFGAYLNNFFSH